MARYLICPPDFTLMNYTLDEPVPMLVKDDSSGQTLFGPSNPATLKKYVMLFLLSDPQFCKDQDARRAATGIRKAIATAKAGDVLRLEDAHAEMLQKVAKTPGRPLPSWAEQFEDFDAAIENMKTKKEDAARRLREDWPELTPPAEALIEA